MDLNIIFRKIKEKMTDTDGAFLLVVVSFLAVALARWVFGFVPGYFLIAMIPLFFASLLRPKAGLFGLIFLTILFERFFTLESFQFGKAIIKLYPLDIVLFGVYGGVLVKLMYTKVQFTLDRITFFLFGFFLLASVYFVGSLIGFGNHDVSIAFSTWKNYVFYGILFFALPFILENESDVKQLVKYFLSAVILGILFIIIGAIRGEGLWTEFTPLSTEGVRLLAFPHAFYFSLAFLGMFVTADYWSQSRYRSLIWIILALWAFGILGSLMRHMWIGMLVALSFTWIFFLGTSARERAKKMLTVAFTLGTILLLFWLFVSLLLPTSTIGRVSGSALEVVVTRITSIGDAADTSISWRGSTWQSAFSRLSQDPLFGSGFGVRIPVESGDYRDFVEMRNIHNSWLALLVQMGVGGFVVLGTFLLFFATRVVRVRNTTPFLAAFRIALLTLLGYQTIVFFAQPYLETNLTGIFFWLTLGLMNVVVRLSSKKDTLHI